VTWVQDFLDGVLFLLRTGKTGRWHVSSAGAVTQAQVVERARERLGHDAPPSKGRGLHALPRVPGMTALDGSKLAEAGHSMRSWEAGLEAYLKSLGNQAAR
jgi:dTDP-4-dehydrorhamnose reductase